MDDAIAPIADKVYRQQRLSETDALELAGCTRIHELGALADSVRRRLHGLQTYYNVNRHIHYSNLCRLRCRVCSFGRQQGQAGAYELSLEQIAQQAAQARSAGATEVHVTGGLHPHWKLDHYRRMLQGIRQAAPGLHIKAFTASEILHMAQLSAMDVAGVLGALRESGLDSMPGGGAEILDDSVRARLFPGKISSADWLDVHRQAHRLGLPTNATMLYGHGEPPRQRVAHLLALRRLQDETGGFQAFVPLAFVPPSEAGADGDLPAHGPGASEDLHVVALSRLVLDNIPHIKTFWIMHSLNLSSIALHYGADDLDGTVDFYDIVPAAGGVQSTTSDQLQATIRQAALEPCQRDSLYRIIANP